MAFVDDLPEWGKGWLVNEGIAPGTPFLLSPVFEYDIELNAYFTKELATSSPKTQEASARDLAAFLTFLWRPRGGRSWRDATEDDHRCVPDVASAGSARAESVGDDVGPRSRDGQ
jgi:hypothetical protein